MIKRTAATTARSSYGATPRNAPDARPRRGVRSATTIAKASKSSSRPLVSQLVSKCVEAKADLQRFEKLAGRGAMLGFVSALFIEGATGSSILSPAQSSAACDGDAFLFTSRLCGAAAVVLTVSLFETLARKSQSVMSPEDVANLEATRMNDVDSAIDEVLQVIPIPVQQQQQQ